MFLWRESWRDDKEGQRDKMGQEWGRRSVFAYVLEGKCPYVTRSPTMNIYIESSELYKLKTKL